MVSKPLSWLTTKRVSRRVSAVQSSPKSFLAHRQANKVSTQNLQYGIHGQMSLSQKTCNRTCACVDFWLAVGHIEGQWPWMKDCPQNSMFPSKLRFLANCNFSDSLLTAIMLRYTSHLKWFIYFITISREPVRTRCTCSDQGLPNSKQVHLSHVTGARRGKTRVTKARLVLVLLLK